MNIGHPVPNNVFGSHLIMFGPLCLNYIFIIWLSLDVEYKLSEEKDKLTKVCRLPSFAILGLIL